jgi:peptidyl-prolyl cis-trans isomerase C
MLRILSGTCPVIDFNRKLPFTRCRRTGISRLAVTLLGLAGCVQDQSIRTAGLGREPPQVAKASEPAATPAVKPSGESNTAANPASQSEQPTVSRFQKAEDKTLEQPAQGSILDLISYHVQGPTDGSVAVQIRATVNGVAILDEEVRSAIYPILMAIQRLPEPERSTRRKEVFAKQIDHLIEREVILQEALARLKDHPQVMEKFKEAAAKEFDKKIRSVRESQHVKTDEEFKALLTAQGLTLAHVQRQIEREFMATEYMRNLILPALERIGHEQIEDFYLKHPEEFQVQDTVTWQDIFIDAAKHPNRDAAHQFATQLVAKARAGEDFKSLITRYDQGDSSYRNGEGYGHHPGEIKPAEAESILFRMRAGEIGPIIETRNGFHVIHLVKRDYKGLKPFDVETQRAIKKKLEMETWEREYKRIVARMKSEASIQVSSR